MAVNRVEYGSETIVDLTSDTVTPETLLKGVTAHDKSGNMITGTYEGGDQVVTINGTATTEATINNEIRAYAKSMAAGRFCFEYIPANNSNHSKFGSTPFLVEGFKSSRGDIFLEAFAFASPFETRKCVTRYSADINYWGQWWTIIDEMD